jgi:hypothetical protein
MGDTSGRRAAQSAKSKPFFQRYQTAGSLSLDNLLDTMLSKMMMMRLPDAGFG